MSAVAEFKDKLPQLLHMRHGNNHVLLYLVPHLLPERIFRYCCGNAFISDWPVRNRFRRARPYYYGLWLLVGRRVRATERQPPHIQQEEQPRQRTFHGCGAANSSNTTVMLARAGYPRAPTTARCACPAAWRAGVESRAPSAGFGLWTTGITITTPLRPRRTHSLSSEAARIVS